MQGVHADVPVHDDRCKLKEHSDNKHPKNDFYQCFPHLKA